MFWYILCTYGTYEKRNIVRAPQSVDRLVSLRTNLNTCSFATLIVCVGAAVFVKGNRRESTVKILGAESYKRRESSASVDVREPTRSVKIKVSGLSTSWSDDEDKLVLNDVTFEVDQVLIARIIYCDLFY